MFTLVHAAVCEHFVRMESLTDRVAAAVEATGMSKAHLARMSGISARTLHHYISGARKPSLEFLVDISRISGKSLDWIIAGTLDARSADMSSLAPIDLWDIEAAAGPGRILDQEHRSGSLAFQVTWLNENRIDPGQAALIRVRGTSMEPTIHDGAMIMIDRRRDRIRNLYIYAFVRDGALSIKRLERTPDALLAHSDNPAPEHPTWVIPAAEADSDAFQIVGQVVWSAWTWPDAVPPLRG